MERFRKIIKKETTDQVKSINEATNEFILLKIFRISSLTDELIGHLITANWRNIVYIFIEYKDLFDSILNLTHNSKKSVRSSLSWVAWRGKSHGQALSIVNSLTLSSCQG